MLTGLKLRWLTYFKSKFLELMTQELSLERSIPLSQTYYQIRLIRLSRLVCITLLTIVLRLLSGIFALVLNGKETPFPGTNLRLIYKLVSDETPRDQAV